MKSPAQVEMAINSISEEIIQGKIGTEKPKNRSPETKGSC